MTQGTAARVLQAFRWGLLWGALFIAGQLLGVLLNAAALWVDFLDVASKAHVDRTDRFVEEQIISDLPIAVVYAFPLVIALAVLWFVGPRLRSRGFRVLSFVAFLWCAPFMAFLVGTELHFELWLLVSVVVAAVIRLPRDRVRATVPA